MLSLPEPAVRPPAEFFRVTYLTAAGQELLEPQGLVQSFMTRSTLPEQLAPPSQTDRQESIRLNFVSERKICFTMNKNQIAP